MVDWLQYKGIEIPDATPPGAAGLRLKENFQALVDWNPRSVWDSTADPTASDDETENFYPGSLWLNAQDNLLFICLDSAEGAAVWERVLKKVAEDPAPQLGGELDADGHSIGLTQQPISSSSGAAAIDWGLGNAAALTLVENTTLSFTAPAHPGHLTLKVTQDNVGGHGVTWPGEVKWPGGTPPSLTASADAVDLVNFYYDGADYLGTAALDFS